MSVLVSVKFCLVLFFSLVQNWKKTPNSVCYAGMFILCPVNGSTTHNKPCSFLHFFLPYNGSGGVWWLVVANSPHTDNMACGKWAFIRLDPKCNCQMNTKPEIWVSSRLIIINRSHTTWFTSSRRWCIDKLGSFMQTKYLCVLIHIWIKGEGSCRTATLDFFSIWLNLKSQCFCALSWPVMESPFVLGKTRFLDNPTI